MNFKSLPSPVPDFKVWGCRNGIYSFVISLEEKSGIGFENYTGYTASWKNAKFEGKQTSIRIDGGPWKTFKEAEEACYKTLLQLKAKN